MFPFRWDDEFILLDDGKPFPPADIVVGRIDALLANTGHYATARGHSNLDYASMPFRVELLFNPVEQYRVRRAYWNGELRNLLGLMERGSIRIADVPGGLEVHVHYDLRRSSAIWALFGGFLTFALWRFEVGIAFMAAFVVAWSVMALVSARSGIRMLPSSIRRIAGGEFRTGPVQQLL